MKMKVLTKVLMCGLFVANFALAADWPTFRGDILRSGKSTETGLLKQWPEGGPKLLWSVEGKLGSGWSSCAVVDGTSYTVGMDEKTQIGTIYAIADGGKVLWEKDYGKEWQKAFRGARTTPTVAGDKVYIISGQLVVFCFDKNNGDIIWQQDIQKNYNIKAPFFGYSESPLVYDGKVICSAGGDTASLVALDAATGKEVWKTKSLDSQCAYTSPALIEHNGIKMIVTMFSKLAFAVNPENGELLWTVHYEGYESNEGVDRNGKSIKANSPVYYDGKLFWTGGYNCGGVIVKLSDDCRKVNVEKYLQEFDNHHHGVVLHNGYVYGSNWDGNDKGRWLCLDLNTQKINYEVDWDLQKSAVAFADGLLYCYQEKSGKVCLVKPDPEKLQVISEFTVTQGKGQHWAHPSISDGKLYIRHGDSLMVYKIK